MLFVRIVIIIYIEVSITSTAPKAQHRRRCPGGWSCPTCSSRTPKFLRGPPLSTRMYSETCLYTCISRDMPHNPVSRDASHVFAERQTRGHNYLFQVPVNHRILHILHPRPRVAAMPESMENMPRAGSVSVLRITSIPPAQITVQVWLKLAVLLPTLWQRFVGPVPPSTSQSVCTS